MGAAKDQQEVIVYKVLKYTNNLQQNWKLICAKDQTLPDKNHLAIHIAVPHFMFIFS